MEFPKEYNIPPFRMTRAAYNAIDKLDVITELHYEAKRRKDAGIVANGAEQTVSEHHTFDDDVFFIRWTKDGFAEVYLLEEA